MVIRFRGHSVTLYYFSYLALFIFHWTMESLEATHCLVRRPAGFDGKVRDEIDCDVASDSDNYSVFDGTIGIFYGMFSDRVISMNYYVIYIGNYILSISKELS